MEAVIVMSLVFFILFILIIRWVGAWMLRIDEVINELKKTNKNLISIYKKIPQNGKV